MPASSATSITRTPATTPMPAITPPPGTDFSGSALSSSQPASVESSRKGTPGSSRRATRSRGSSWPRLSNSGPARSLAARVRASIARQLRRSAPRRARALRREALRRRASRAGMRAPASVGPAARRASTARWKPSNASVRAAGADLGPDALGVRRRAVDAQAGAGDERRRRREQEARSPPRPRSRCRGGAAARAACRPRMVLAHLGRIAGPCRWRRSSPARPR